MTARVTTHLPPATSAAAFGSLAYITRRLPAATTSTSKLSALKYRVRCGTTPIFRVDVVTFEPSVKKSYAIKIGKRL